VIIKRVNVRVEHCRHSKCRQEFLDRVQRNDAIKRAAKEKGEKAPLESIKRFPIAPKAGYVVAADSAHGTPVLVAPAPFDEML
jgi:large subunit ribosomal protein L21e